MRTVTFSDPGIAKEINSRFVPVWINRGPGFHNCDFRTEDAIFQNAQEAYSTRNICTFFMTPDETVLHYVAGYYSPNVFRNALLFARRIQSVSRNPEKIRKEHARFAELSRQEVKKMQNLGWKKALARYGSFNYGRKHTHSSRCKRFIVEAMEYWARLHTRFASTRSFPSFSTVKTGYLSGNRFSEEPRWGTPTRQKREGTSTGKNR